MIKRISESLLLRPQDLKPLRDDFTVIGVFNPGAVKVNGQIVLLARVAEKPRDHRPGLVGLLGVEGKRVGLTFGLLSPNKGIEHVLQALPDVVREVQPVCRYRSS